MDKGSLSRAPALSRTVRIHVPSEVAYDLERMQKVTASVLGKLVCGGCHSGHVLEFVHLRDFVINPKTLDVQEQFIGH